MKLHNFTLEVSGKPFYNESEKVMYQAGETMFCQWKNITDTAETVSVMLWIADGSEILDYSGDPDQTFEWGYWLGVANHTPRPEHPTELDKRHFFPYPKKYREDAGPRSYRWLKRLVEVLRECSLRINGKPLEIIATFDNGPEFALSPFKYEHHLEICGGKTAVGRPAVICNSVLHGDTRKYKAFPNGIPEGTSFGHFFGSQFREFARDLGFDSIWFSNGMGFGKEPWHISGFLFDNKQFYPDAAETARNTMLGFWQDFTAACPGVKIRTRGSNYSAGIEMASDGAPLEELYEHFKIAPPVNSPWAAINYNSGLEIAAWMSHIARLPEKGFPFRFYPHDPWFLNSPWLDRYEREAWDIYLPLSVSRIDENGKTQIPDGLSLLSIDNSYGEMPEQVPLEVIPHLQEAFRNAPDNPAPFVWGYPFKKYSAMVHREKRPDIVFNEELFIGETIQAGFPLNTVAELANFDKIPATAILVMPVSAYNEQAEAFLEANGRIIFYGALVNAPESLRKHLGLTCGSEITGWQKIVLHTETDTFREKDTPQMLYVDGLFDGGGLTEYPCGAKVLAEAGNRVLASVNGNAAFVRSVIPPTEAVVPKEEALAEAGIQQVFPVESLLRTVAAEFGWIIRFSAFSGKSMLPRINVCRHDNMFFFNVFARDTTAEIRISTPPGAPLLEGMETELSHGQAIWHPSRCWHKRCTAFVEQKEDGVISMRKITAEEPGLLQRLMLDGLKDATIRFFLPEKDLPHLEMVNDILWHYYSSERTQYEIEETEFGKCAVLRHITGTLLCGTLEKV